jgi:hypothetical protein
MYAPYLCAERSSLTALAPRRFQQHYEHVLPPLRRIGANRSWDIDLSTATPSLAKTIPRDDVRSPRPGQA